uniref:YEATS domain-containing protein 4 n=1 Tax=Parastrongyloides trichosuri TaxID=131310 RepID=A0A0N4ZQM9_PARTI
MSIDSGNQERRRGAKVVKPFVIGNTAKPLDVEIIDESGKARTHEWVIFVKPYLNEDMSKYVKKVQFKLHESYENNIKVVEHPPFEVRETCWAESEVMVKIFFNDQYEKPLTLYHYVRIREDGATYIGTDGTVAAEHYDEFIFKEPTLQFEKLLVDALISNELNVSEFKTNFEDTKRIQMDQIIKAREMIKREIEDLKKSIIDGQDFLRIKSEELQNILNSKNEETSVVVQESVK